MELWQSRAKVATGDGVGDGSVTSYLNVTCYARGIYPEPKMELLREPPTLLEDEGSGAGEGGPAAGSGDSSGGGDMVAEVDAFGGGASVETTWRPEAGVFDIRASESLPERTLASPTVFHCELRIPEADYSVRRSIVYYPGSPELSNGGARVRLGSCCYWIRLILALLCLCLAFVHAPASLPPILL